jgi:hypothetical protein
MLEPQNTVQQGFFGTDRLPTANLRKNEFVMSI